MRPLVLAVVGAAMLVGKVYAVEAPQTLEALDAKLAQALADDRVPGASVAVIEGGQVVLSKGYGFADVAAKVAATPDTIFRAGSISKSLTGIAVMTLVEQGKLDLNAKLADLAPEVKFINPWEDTHPVRLADLLEHTTGWPDVSLRVYMMDGRGWSTWQGVEAASNEFVSRYPPGQFPVYNNAGPAVAGYILEKASGKTFSAYLRDDVLRPTGMPTADFDMPPALQARLARSYDPAGKETPYQYIILPPAGSLATSARELSQLVRLMIGRGTIDGRSVLSPQSMDRLERSETTLASAAGFTNGYGFGNTPFPDDGLSFRGHNGAVDSFTSVFGYRAADGMGFVLLANGGKGVDFTSKSAQLIKAYLLRHMTLKAPPVTPVSASELATYGGYYRNITPSNRLSQPFTDVLGYTHVTAKDDHLVISGNDFLPAGSHGFRRADREVPTLGFVAHDGDIYKINALNAQMKVPVWQMIALWTEGALLVTGLLLSIVMLPVWMIAGVRRRLAQRGGAAVRFVPLLGMIALIATFLMPLSQVGAGEAGLRRLATVGPVSVTIFVCSILFPLCAIGGLWLAWRGRAVPRFARGYATITCLALAAAAVYAASVGWVGAMTWNM